MILINYDKDKLLEKLSHSRLRLLINQGFYGNLLMHMELDIDEEIDEVSVARNKICFNPTYLMSLQNKELDLILMHEVMHLSLKHNLKRRMFEDKERFDLACDLVVNSNILKSFHNIEDKIKLFEKSLPHLIPIKNEEAYHYSIEQVYEFIEEYDIKASNIGGRFDDHSGWEQETSEDIGYSEWDQYTIESAEMVFIRNSGKDCGDIPGYALRKLNELKKPQTDWRVLLNNFIQEEVNDYSFTPPDKRFDDYDFFLPDLNDTGETIKDVLFMVDTSGSMSDDDLTDAYSEIKGAIDQFNGKLEGYLGFFDCSIVEPVPFKDVEDIVDIRPIGGGGTDFSIIFKYIRDKMKDKEISSIVILTDGYAPWPSIINSEDIPVIWLINNKEQTPPWGKVARLIKRNRGNTW